MSGEDVRWMEQVLALAALGDATARPNPRVGCVVVDSGVAVGWGWHRAPGDPHAEVVAIERAGARARSATLYVNLEPCAHHGRTPPCVDRIVSSAVARVVASIRDPNPLVDGRGFERLREAGIDVDIGILDGPARRMNAGFLHWHGTGRPRVTVKFAGSIDGRTTARDGVSRWITTAASRRFAHRLRMCHDAILVGAGTVRADDPSLDVRIDGVDAQSPTRVVVAPSGAISPTARVLRDDGASVIVYVSTGHRDRLLEILRSSKRVEVVDIPWHRDGVLDVDSLLDDLGTRGTQTVLVEGGASTIGRFAERGRIDDVVSFQSPAWLGAAGSRPVSDSAAAVAPDRAARLRVLRRLSFGEDLVIIGTFDRREGHEGCSRD